MSILTKIIAVTFDVNKANKLLESEINSFSQSVSIPSNKQWQQLSANRILASNTLSKSMDLVYWESANQLVASYIANRLDINIRSIQKLNALLNPGSKGKVRMHDLYSADIRYMDYKVLAKALEYFQVLVLDPQQESFEKILLTSFKIYLWLITLHCFDNANGRTARLIADWNLMGHNILPLSFETPISSHVAITDKILDYNVNESYQKFLKAIIRSYKILSIK